MKRALDCSEAISQTDSIFRDETSRVASKFVVIGDSRSSQVRAEATHQSNANPLMRIPQ